MKHYTRPKLALLALIIIQSSIRDPEAAGWEYADGFWQYAPNWSTIPRVATLDQNGNVLLSGETSDGATHRAVTRRLLPSGDWQLLDDYLHAGSSGTDGRGVYAVPGALFAFANAELGYWSRRAWVCRESTDGGNSWHLSDLVDQADDSYFIDAVVDSSGTIYAMGGQMDVTYINPQKVRATNYWLFKKFVPGQGWQTVQRRRGSSETHFKAHSLATLGSVVYASGSSNDYAVVMQTGDAGATWTMESFRLDPAQPSSASLLIANETTGSIYVLGGGTTGTRKNQQTIQFVRKKTQSGPWENPVPIPQGMLAFNSGAFDTAGNLHLTGRITGNDGISRWKSVMWDLAGQWTETDYLQDIGTSAGTCLIGDSTGNLYAAGLAKPNPAPDSYHWVVRRFVP